MYIWRGEAQQAIARANQAVLATVVPAVRECGNQCPEKPHLCTNVEVGRSAPSPKANYHSVVAGGTGKLRFREGIPANQ
jgi:hypothetical protein